MNKNIEIRLETEKDYDVVEKLTFVAFETMELPGREFTNEHFYAHLLRGDESFVPKLDFVAEVNGEIMGNIMYHLLPIATDDLVKDKVLALAILSVKPELHGKGVGSCLIKHSLKRAKELGYKAVLILGGHKNYYSRFDFVPANKYGLKWLDGSELDAFLALELETDYLGNGGGSWKLPDIFRTLVNEEYFKVFHEEFLKQ
ncbi:N-acetyltransferase [Lachnospiraceae bacterium ZAX-1]